MTNQRTRETGLHAEKLPDSYSYIGDLIDALKDSDKMCEFVKNKISMWEMKSQSDLSKKKTSAFKTGRKMTCFEWGKPGHIKRDCWSKRQSGSGIGAGGVAP